MRTPLRIAVVQPACEPYDVAGNAARHATAVRAADARVVVFPELSLTGYHLDAPVLDPEDPALTPLVEACTATGALALAGAPVAGDHIATVAGDGRGARVAYRKMWLGGGEPQRFSPGAAPSVLEVDGWRLGLAICKDTGIAEHARCTVGDGIDVYVASVLEHDRDAAVTDERALRIATGHRVHVAVASFAGSTGEGYAEAAGRSAIWSPDGTVLVRAGTATGGMARTVLS